MAEQGRTVRVSGLPADIEDDRLKDKLLIHFLRRRNGGGEVESVSIDKATSACALITFEDSGVAQGVIQHGRHILEVDGKKHKVVVTEYQESLDPDKVIPSLTAAVDYSRLPGGMSALQSLHESFPDIQINYQTTNEFCMLQGTYSKVQAALAQLLGHPGGLQSAETSDSGQPTISGSSLVQKAHKPDTHESDQRRKPNKQSQQREKDHSSRLNDEYRPSSYRHLTTGGFDWEDTGQTEGAALQPDEPPDAADEDLSLIVDADMFQYLQRHCSKDYQKILTQYSVEVLDVTNQGLTTLFLQVASGVGEDGRDQERMKLAKKSISRLYQENEAKIRKAHLPKIILSPRGGLQRAIENLSVRLPKLLLNEDKLNIYIIGSSSDVSEAKQFLLLDHGEEKEDIASVLRYSPNDSGTSSYADKQMSTLTSPSSVDPLDPRMDQLLRSEEDEKRDEGVRRFKLAARFKDSGLAALGNRPTDFSLRGLSSPRGQAHTGPMLGHDVLSEAADIPGEGVPRALSQNTGGDILFRSGNSLPSVAPVKNKTSLNSHLTDTRPTSLTSPLMAAQSSLSGSSPRPPAGSGSSLKRASSFSGTPQQKAQIIGQRSQEDSGKIRARSSSFSNQTGGHKQEGYTAEITVSFLMWQHIKKAYSTRVEDLTSDVQIKESGSKLGTDQTLTIRGATLSKVGSCQQGLQKLVDSVSVDFCVQELQLSELGVSDRDDEALQACCDEVRSQFKKVTIQAMKTSLFLLGPIYLCSQVGASLREVFSGVLAPNPEQHDLSSHSASGWDASAFLQTNQNHGAGVQSYGYSEVMLERHTTQAGVTGSGHERRKKHGGDLQETELMNGSISQSPVKKNVVIKEKVKLVGTAEMLGQRAVSGNDSSVSHVNGVGSTTTTGIDGYLVQLNKETTTNSNVKENLQRSKTETQDPPEAPKSAAGGPGCICVCGETNKLMVRTKCGASFCSSCLDSVHSKCRVCHEAELTPRGIRGKMKSSRVPIKIPGSKKDSAIKITYIIPDGIQGEGHPSPGKPFKGGIFEAFFPDSEESRRLLPRLDKAFRKGLTFTVTEKEKGAQVFWDCIPHKTTLQGGKSGSGYPDSSYLTRLSKVLTSHGIEEPPAKSE
ncbi:uncharacterized protein si:busm1-163l24.3 [Notolabrus celidotus]|uniref:uncharacterized protein si:busm1-163l24.3 n=1 Tax=Notolabrus celidotus TaxID=1203425 RepID=UPI00149036F2|nr:uncharacterized protein si:busm1-163l24.3 [Notolabrus celidotus]